MCICVVCVCDCVSVANTYLLGNAECVHIAVEDRPKLVHVRDFDRQRRVARLRGTAIGCLIFLDSNFGFSETVRRKSFKSRG